MDNVVSIVKRTENFGSKGQLSLQTPIGFGRACYRHPYGIVVVDVHLSIPAHNDDTRRKIVEYDIGPVGKLLAIVLVN